METGNIKKLSTSMEKITGIKAYLRQTMGGGDKTLEQIRAQTNVTAPNQAALPDAKIKRTTVAGMNAEWVAAGDAKLEDDRAILYIHGGAFVSGSCATHRDLAARISQAAGVRVLLFEYRLAPENQYPAANEDCLAAIKWLVSNGVAAKDIVIGGESTGGYLSLATLLSLRDAGGPMPAAAFLLSPHTDFYYYDGESYHTRAQDDPTSSLKDTKSCAGFYFDPSVTDPAVLSPLNCRLNGLPPLFIQAGDSEVILSDSTRLAKRAAQAGVKVTLEVWENMWHIFRFMAAMLPEGQQAIENIGAFAKKHLQ